MASEKRRKQQRDFAKRKYDAAPLAQMLKNVRHRAKQRGIFCDLKLDDIIVPPSCPVLGFPISFGHHNRDMRPSLDRWDNAIGYTRANTRVISLRANRIKNDATAVELYAVARYAAGA